MAPEYAQELPHWGLQILESQSSSFLRAIKNVEPGSHLLNYKPMSRLPE